MQMRTVIIVGIALAIAIILILTLGRDEGNSLIPQPLDMKTDGARDSRSFLTRRFKAEQIALVAGSSDQCSLGANRVVISTDATCVFTLEPSTRWTRQLTLSLQGSDGTINVILNQNNALTVEEELTANQAPFDFDVYRQTENQVAQMTIFDCKNASEEEDSAGCMLTWE